MLNSPITDRAMIDICNKKDKANKAHNILDRIEKNPGWSSFVLWGDDGEIETVREALKCYESSLRKDAANKEVAIELGSEEGDLTSHDEERILKGCVKLMNRVMKSMNEWFFIVFGETTFEDMTDDDKPYVPIPYTEIVRTLFLAGTTHSGGTSTRAKCRELGVKPEDLLELQFKAETEE